MEDKRPESMKRINTKELADTFIEEQVALLRKQIGEKKVLLALSGGVDSSVVAALLIKAVGKQLVCVHVNHGLLRKGEPEQVIRVFKEEMDANLVYVDAVDRFLDKLAGVDDPETKRKIIGTEFIRVFEEEARKLEGIEFLAQGTIYPDIVESAGVKAHHNAGGLPDDLKFELVEPLRYLYKDEELSAKSSLFPTAWFSVSPSPVPVSVYVASVLSPATVSKPFANPTRSCAKNLQKRGLKAKFGSISRQFRTSAPPASRTANAALNGPSSSAPSTPWTR